MQIVDLKEVGSVEEQVESLVKLLNAIAGVMAGFAQPTELYRVSLTEALRNDDVLLHLGVLHLNDVAVRKYQEETEADMKA